MVAARASLPSPGSALVGRDAELTALSDQLATGPSRLVTLTGPPGVGKTRLALAVAESAAERLPDGVVWVDLAPVRDPGLVLDEIAHAAGISRGDLAGGPDELSLAWADHELLLVLDNCEHLLAAAPAVGDLIVAVPRLRVLATSRERLRLVAEREHPVPPLPMPSDADTADLRRLASNPAIALMLNHAPAYVTVSARTAQPLVDICSQLDGLPLALEFAAARMRVFTPSELAFRLGQRIGELTGGAVDAPERHQDLRTAIVWSHDLLPEAERAVFRRLSVFESGWTVAAAEAVCAGPQCPDVLAALESLLDKSLVRRLSGDEETQTRFGMLLSLREYAGEQLVAHDEAAATRAAHATWFAGICRAWEATIGTDDEDMTWQRGNAMRADLDAARVSARTSADVEAELWLATALAWFWFTRGSPIHAREIVQLAGSAMPDDASPGARSAALAAAGGVALALGDLDSADRSLLAAAELCDSIGDRRRSAIVAAFLGHVARERGDQELAAGYYRTTRGIYEDRGNYRGTAWAHYDLGMLAADGGDLAVADAELDEALARFEAIDYSWAVAVCACALGGVRLGAGRPDDAAPLLARALQLHDQVGDRRGTAQCLEALADLAAARGFPGSAAKLLGAAASRRTAVAAHPTEAEQERIARVAASAEQAIGAAATEQERQSGLRATTPTVLALASRIAGDGDDEPEVQLTPRQQEVAELVAAGHTNRQIARQLGISEKTAELHVHNTMQRLGAHNRAAVAAWVSARAVDAPS